MVLFQAAPHQAGECSTLRPFSCSPPVLSPKHPRTRTAANFRIILCELSLPVGAVPLADRGNGASATDDRSLFDSPSTAASLPSARRRFILIRSVVAAGVSLLVGLIIITALEFGVGKSLSCWVWDECIKESSAERSGRTARASTLPSVLGGGQRAGSSIPQEDSPSNLRQQPGVQQQPDSLPGTPPQAPSRAPSQALAPPPLPADPSVQQQPGQRQGPSGVPTGEDPQQAPPSAAPEDQQQLTPGAAPQDQPLGEEAQPLGAANDVPEGMH